MNNKKNGKIKKIYILCPPFLFLLAFVFCAGCAWGKKNLPDDSASKKLQVFIIDLNNDGAKEIIEAEDRFDQEYRSDIRVKKKNKEAVDSFSVAGSLLDLKFVDLNFEGSKQIAVIFRDGAGRENIEIYALKNKRLDKLFALYDAEKIQTDFEGVLARVKLLGPHAAGEAYYSNYSRDWQVWVWAGEGFIRER